MKIWETGSLTKCQIFLSVSVARLFEGFGFYQTNRKEEKKKRKKHNVTVNHKKIQED